MKSSRFFLLILTVSLAVFSCGKPGADPDDLPDFNPGGNSQKEDPLPDTGVLPSKDGFLAMGFVKDAETGNGIPNVVVSDGWNCVKTDSVQTRDRLIILVHNILETIRWWQLVHPGIETDLLV